jgi:Tol biopolymer transport system component
VRIYADTQKIGVGPSWSPDANHLAYYDGVQARIVVLDVLNGNETYLPSVAGVMGSWSPDGKQMIYFDTQTVSNVSVNLLYRADFETQDVLPFFDPQPTDADYSNPAVSPDGAWVAMRVRSREQGSDDQVWITPADGSFATVVTDEPGYLYSNYSWDPWAKNLLYYRLQLRGAGHRPEIWLWLRETGATGLLVEDGNSPLWLP